MDDEEESGVTRPTWTWRITNYSHLPDPNRPEQDKALSWVRCSVEGQPGAVVRLMAADTVTEHDVIGAEAGTRPDYGPYFCELGPLKAGWYTLEVEGIDAAVTLWLDGAASAAVDLVPGKPSLAVAPVERLPHVLLLGQTMTHRGNFLALTRYVARFGAVVTFDPDEAAAAEHVILIGSTQLISAEIEEQLRQRGVRVERAQGDIAAQLDGAIAAGTPFLCP